MPSGSPRIIPIICETILELKPESVLDIGIGFGKFGLLAREYIELWRGGQHVHHIENYGNWKSIVDGIEIYEPYILDHHKAIYDQIFIGDALDILTRINEVLSYDLIICSDVLEHLDHDRGIELLKIARIMSKHALFLIPVEPCKQGSEWENIHETHKSVYLQEELDAFGQVSVVQDLYYLLMMKGDAHE